MGSRGQRTPSIVDSEFRCTNAYDPRAACLLFAGAVLPIADLFHPVDHLAVFLLLNGDVRHGCSRRGTVPVLLAGGEPDHITGMDLLDRSAFALSPAATSRDDESLTERMGMPRCPCARLESYARTLNKCRIGRLK